MLDTLQRSSELNPEFAESIAALVQATLRNLLLVLGGTFLLWFIIATATWPETFDWRARGVIALLFFICLAAYQLLPTYANFAHVFWQAAMLAAISAAVWILQQPQLMLLYLLLPFVAVVATRWSAGLWLEVPIMILVLWLPSVTASAAWSEPFGLAIIIGSLCAAFVGRVISHTLLTALEWYAFSFSQTQQNLASARQHRAQLMRTQKSLDEAYYLLKRTNSALVAAWKVADEAERFKAEFVTNVSHELRTPLNLIVGFSEVMMTSPESYGRVPLPGAYRSDLNAIYHSAQHLLALVDDVIDLARIEAGKIALARDEVDMAELVTETVSMVKDYVATKGLDMQVCLADAMPRLWIDRLRIRQVLLNLLVNAARFTEKGYVRVDVALNEQEVLVKVSDSGQGIPAKDLPKLFEEFRATEQPFSTWHSGTGLGLPISRKFVELHNGRMGVESVVQRGTSFWFTLPARPVTNAQPRIAPAQRSEPPTRLLPSERIVVLVHDDTRVAPLLQRYLDGYRVLTATDAHAGVELAVAVKALALILDVNQSTPASPSDVLPDAPPDLLIVHCPLPSAHHAALGMGADNLLAKPITRQELFAAIDDLPRPVHRILIADDDPEVVRLYRRMLRTYEPAQEFWEAYNGEEALRLMRAHTPDLVLLDLVMPGTDGHSVLEQMAADARIAGIATIVISTRGQDFVSSCMAGTLQIGKAGGFQIGEMVRTLEALLTTLAPGWHQPAPSGRELSTMPVG